MMSTILRLLGIGAPAASPATEATPLETAATHLEAARRTLAETTAEVERLTSETTAAESAFEATGSDEAALTLARLRLQIDRAGRKAEEARVGLAACEKAHDLETRRARAAELTAVYEAARAAEVRAEQEHAAEASALLAFVDRVEESSVAHHNARCDRRDAHTALTAAVLHLNDLDPEAPNYVPEPTVEISEASTSLATLETLHGRCKALLESLDQEAKRVAENMAFALIDGHDELVPAYVMSLRARAGGSGGTSRTLSMLAYGDTVRTNRDHFFPGHPYVSPAEMVEVLLTMPRVKAEEELVRLYKERCTAAAPATTGAPRTPQAQRQPTTPAKRARAHGRHTPLRMPIPSSW